MPIVGRKAEGRVVAGLPICVKGLRGGNTIATTASQAARNLPQRSSTNTGVATRR